MEYFTNGEVSTPIYHSLPTSTETSISPGHREAILARRPCSTFSPGIWNINSDEIQKHPSALRSSLFRMFLECKVFLGYTETQVHKMIEVRQIVCLFLHTKLESKPFTIFDIPIQQT